MRDRFLLLCLVIMTLTIAACGANDDEATAQDTGGDDATIDDAAVAVLDDPFPAPDYQDFTLTHAVTLCEGIAVPFAASLSFSWDAGFERCSLSFASDDLAGRPETEEDVDFRAYVLPNDIDNTDDFGDRTQAQIIDFITAAYSTIAASPDNTLTEMTINGRPAFHYEGLSLKADASDPDVTQSLHIIDFSTPDNPTYVVLYARAATAEIEQIRPIIDTWVNSAGNDTALDELVYVYDLPNLTIELPSDAIAVEPATFNLRFDDDPGDDPLFLSIITPSGDDNSPNLFQFSIPEIPPAEGKTYTLVSTSENTDQVGSLFRFSDGTDTYFMRPQDASATLSSDGYVLNIEVSGTFSLSGETPPIVGDFDFNLRFTSIPLPD